MSVKSFVKGKPEKLARAKLKCGCGLMHEPVALQMLALNNAAGGVNFYVKQFGKMAYFLIEQEAAEICGERIAAKIPQKCRSGASSVRSQSVLECDEIVKKIPGDTTVLVAVGGKNACQAGKYISGKLELPLIFVAVIADDDDMLTNRSVLKNKGSSEIFAGKPPQVVFVSVNEAFKLCKGMGLAAALICSNLLLSLESKFNFVSKDIYNCAVADSMIAQAANEFAVAAVKGLSKNSLESAFTALLRISAAKAISKQGVYDTSFAAVCNLIGNETGLDKAVVAGTVFDVLADCFNLVLTNCDILHVAEEGDDISDKSITALKGKIYDYSFTGVELNKQRLLDELEAISKLSVLIKSLCAPDAKVTRQVLERALKNAGGYGFDGIIAYGCGMGLF